MMMKSDRIVVAIPTNGIDGREEISGVFDYVNKHTNWEIQIISTRTDIATGMLEAALKDTDGLILAIACEITQHANKLFNENPLLRVVVTNDHLVPQFAKYPRCRTLLIDSMSVGKDVAHYFCSMGRFAAYGFVHGAMHYPWSIEREEGFRSALPRGAPFFAFFPDEAAVNVPNDVATLMISHDKLRDWLKKLPKPAAVFGANDMFAREVVTVCTQIGIKVPQQISVVGCDNDPLVCGNIYPSLSSFQLPFRELGFKSAQTLDRLLRGRNPPQHTIRVAGTHLFERGSTVHIPPATVLVEKARTFISEQACNGIRVDDVVSHLNVSRSLLDLRFRQVCGKSVLENILDVRLDEVQRQLAKTNHTILQIGRDCGFNNPDNLKILFRKRFGCTMRDWRKKHATRSPKT